MIPIIICCNKEDYRNSLASDLCENLKNYGSSLIYTRKKENNCTYDKLYIDKNSISPKFAIYELENIPIITNIKGILIIKNKFIANKSTIPLNLNGLTTIIYDQDKDVISILKGTGSAVISCGMLTYNTLSIASMDYNTAVVSVQREIRTLNNKIIEPHDFPLYFNRKIDVFTLLISAAVLLLSDVDSYSGYNL